jgi:hypothetical protein
MKFILPALGIALSCLFFFSCQREIHGDISQAVVENGGTVLSKYIELDTTLPSGQDTASVYTFTFDNLKRIKRIYQVKKFTGYSSIFYITTDFFYNGSDASPYKTIELDQENITYVDTSFYTYSNGFVRSDSSVNYRVNNSELLFTDVVSFLVTGINVFVKLSEATPVSGYEDTATLTIARQSGNIISQQDPNNTITYSMQLKYDNNVNPFYSADIHYPIIFEHLINSFNAQKNNMTEEIDFTKLSGTKSHVGYVYTYRSDGYPLEVRKIDLLDPSENRKGLFFYTK